LPFKSLNAGFELPLGGRGLVSGSKAVRFCLSKQKIKKTKNQKGRRAMARADFDTSPRKNPCAQCGHPIAAPDWIEAGPRHASYLWHCRACDYRFEAIAVFSEQESDRQPIAA
jgi:hypothetical protein